MTLDWWNIPEDISSYIGFVYIITNNITGRRYIGKKLFYTIFRRNPLKGRINKRKARKESDWRDYWGSCKELLDDIEKYGKDNFTREILHCHKTRWEWSYAELKEQINRDVLRDRMYYNGIIRVRLPGYKNNIYSDGIK